MMNSPARRSRSFKRIAFAKSSSAVRSWWSQASRASRTMVTSLRSVVVVRILRRSLWRQVSMRMCARSIRTSTASIRPTRALLPMRASSMWFPTMICSSFRAKVQESCNHARLNSRVNTRWSFIPVRHLAMSRELSSRRLLQTWNTPLSRALLTIHRR